MKIEKFMKTYLVLLIDRKQVKYFTLSNGVVGASSEFVDGQVPQKVKHGDDTWDAQDKIFRHIEDHLHRHFLLVFKAVKSFLRENHVNAILIGSHKPLFSKIEKHIPYPLNLKIEGKFVTELKGPFNEVLKRAKRVISQIERRTETRQKYVF